MSQEEVLKQEKDPKILEEQVEEQLNCSICHSTYIDPKQLQCHHVYCQKCLMKLVQRTLICPTCDHVTPIPVEGVPGLLSANGATNTSGNCFAHGKELEFYCEKCEELICSKCCIGEDSKHHNHECQKVDEVFEKYSAEISSSLEPMENLIASVNKGLNLLEAHSGEVSDQHASIEANLHDTFEWLQASLDARKTKLFSLLNEITQGKVATLKTQKQKVEKKQSELNSYLNFAKEMLKTGSQEEVVLQKTAIVKQVRNLTTTFPTDSLKPETQADIVFSPPTDDVTATLENLGDVSAPEMKLVHPSECYATGKGLEEAVVGMKSTANVYSVNFEKQPCEVPIESFQCKLVYESTKVRVRTEKKGRGQFRISYMPISEGKHQLHIKIKDEHIKGSPFSVVAEEGQYSKRRKTFPFDKKSVQWVETRSFIVTANDTIEESSIFVDGLKCPCGIAISQNNELVVTEQQGHCVTLLSPRREKLQSFGTQGSGHGQFECPSGVAVDGDGNILVADTANDRIQKFTTDGKFLTEVGSKGAGPPQFCKPRDIAFNASNKKVYVVDDSHRVQVLNSDLSFCCFFGTQGSDEGQLDTPCGITCDSTGKVYVTDSKNHRIQIFTAEGSFTSVFGKNSREIGKLNSPTGIALGNTSKYVYISDSDHHFSKFDLKGQFMMSFGSEGGEPGMFRSPRGLAVDDCDILYVCDSMNGRIQNFKM